eukprot:GILI01018051.1.p1 GENE.GILI01018051.1~~GILI01018051.1.p1  ORF type:complete len:454 (-),score=67.51 GILI01018051.1:143-1504(-)
MAIKIAIETFPIQGTPFTISVALSITVEDLRAEAERHSNSLIARWYLQHPATGEDGHATLVEITRAMRGMTLGEAGFAEGSLVSVEEEGSYPEKPLFSAIQRSRLDVMEVLIKRGCSVTAKDHIYGTPLHAAARRKEHSVAMMRMLMTHGALLSEDNSTSNTALHSAVQAKNIAAIEFIISLDSSLVTAENIYGGLHTAIANGYNEVLELLISKCDVNSQNRNGETCLHMAARAANGGAIRVLCAHGCKADTTACSGRLALHCAADIRDPALIDLLLAGADINTANCIGDTPLHHAAALGYLQLAERLLEKGADLTIANKKGWTPVHIARNSNITSLLVEYGSDMNAADPEGRTPLIYQCVNGSAKVESIQALIASGCDVTAATTDGNTVLHYKHLGVAKARAMLDEGADPFATNHIGDTPSAVGNTDVIDLLRARGLARKQRSEGIVDIASR